MHDSPLSIEELSRRFNGQQRLAGDLVSGAGAAEVPILEDQEMVPNSNTSVGQVEQPPETAAPPLADRLAVLAAVENDAAHSITPIARVFHAGRRRQRRVVSPSPFVLQQLPSSAAIVSVGQQAEKTLKISSVPLGPSKRKLHMSPFAALDELGGSGGNMAARRRVTRRRVSISGRRRSTSGTPIIPRRRSFLAPPSSADPPASGVVAAPLRTSIANTSPP